MGFVGKVPKGPVAVGSREFYLTGVAGGNACLELGMELITFTYSPYSPHSRKTSQ